MKLTKRPFEFNCILLLCEHKFFSNTLRLVAHGARTEVMAQQDDYSIKPVAPFSWLVSCSDGCVEDSFRNENKEELCKVEIRMALFSFKKQKVFCTIGMIISAVLLLLPVTYSAHSPFIQSSRSE